MVMISVRCLGLLWLLTVLSATAWAEVDVRTNRTEISVDESFTVIFETDSSRAAEPDFSVLETSFEILSSRRRSNYSLVNGRMTGSTAWELELIARETGVIELPPVRFGNESSQPLMITVNEKKEAVDGDGPLLLELEISDSSPYVQGEVICTLRMYFDIASSERRLSEPSMQGIDAVIKRLGDDRSYFATRAQRRYEVIERRYGIYPQASGTLKLESFSLQARILDSQRSFLARTGRMHRVQSEPVTIDVQPIPAEFPGSTWLPARGLAIDQRLDVPTPLHAGEPISLTLEIRADGLNASQLPDLEIAWPDGLRVYPETPVSEEESDARGTRALRRLSMALIAAEAGDFTLPAFRIPWWNTETDQPEFAELPERTITVLPRAGSETATSSPRANRAPAARDEGPFLWRNVSLILGLGWLATLALWWSRRRGNASSLPSPQGSDMHQKTRGQTARRLEKACRAGDAAEARSVLVEWCRHRWPGQPGLSALRQRADSALARELDALDRSLYASADIAWDGKALNRMLKEQFLAEQHRTKTRHREDLTPLHRI